MAPAPVRTRNESLFGRLEQPSDGDFQRFGERPESADSDLSFAALNESDDCPVESGGMGEVLLGEASFAAESFDVVSELPEVGSLR